MGNVTEPLIESLKRLAWVIPPVTGIAALITYGLGLRWLMWPVLIAGGLAYAGIKAFDRMQSLGPSPRSQAIEAFALERGFTFEEAMEPMQAMLLFHSLHDFPLFRKYGKSSSGANLTPGQAQQLALFYRFLGILPMTSIIRGEVNGTRFTCFDYYSRDGGSKNSNVVRQTVLMMHSEKLNAPPFQLRKHKHDLLGMALHAVGWGGIEIPGAPRFGERYALTGKSSEAVRETFSDRAAAYFVDADDRFLSCVLEGRGNDLLLYRPDALIAPEELDAFIADGMAAVAALLPGR